MSEVRRFTKNSLALTTASLSVAILGAVYRIYIARYLGKTEFGQYLFIITLVGYVSVLSLLGLRNVVVREVARARTQYRFIFSAAMRLRLVSTTVSFLLVCIITLLLNRGTTVNLGVAIYALSLFPLAAIDLLESMFIASESAVYVTITNIVSNVLKITVGIWLLASGFGLLAILELFLVISILSYLMNLYFYRRVFRSVKPADIPCVPNVKRFIFLESLPFFYNMLVSRVYYRSDILFLSLIKGDEVTGGYGAAYMALDFLLLAAGSIVGAAYPMMSRIATEKHDRLGYLQTMLCRYLMMLFLPAAVILTIAGPEIVGMVLGKTYEGYGAVLRVVSWVAPIEAITMAMGFLLGAVYKQALSAKIATFSAGITILFNLLFIPRYSYMGAAIATIAAGVLNAAVAFIVVDRVVVRLSVIDIVVRPLIAAGIMLGMGLFVAQSGPRWVAATIAVPVYFAALMATKSITREDLGFIRAIVGRSDKYGVEKLPEGSHV